MKKILGMGNALVDILMQLENDTLLTTLELPKGSMQLIDEEFMLRIAKSTELYSQHIATGGSAANTISGIKRLGNECGYIGKVGNDKVGTFFTNDMRSNGIEPQMIHSTLSSGRCNVFISQDSERTMATHLGAASTLEAGDLNIEMFKGYDIFHIEGYLVQNYPLITRAAELAKAAGLKISLDLASYNIVEENNEFLHNYVKEYVDIVFANEEEAKSFTGHEAEEALNIIAKDCEIAIVKVGSKGSYIKAENTIISVPALKIKAVDTTGAGDIYASGFLYGLANDLPLEKCGKIGSYCAAQVIEVIGAKIPNERWDAIQRYVKELSSTQNLGL